MKKTILLPCLLVAATTHAAVPQTISYQGYLRNAGVPVNATVAITFKLYDAGSGGSPLWVETHGSVVVSNGLFTVVLGSLVPFDLPFDQKYHLGITVDAGPEMAPRHALASMPYSLRSSVTNAFVANAVATSAIQSGTITPDKLASSCATGQILMRSATGWRCASLP